MLELALFECSEMTCTSSYKRKLSLTCHPSVEYFTRKPSFFSFVVCAEIEIGGVTKFDCYLCICRVLSNGDVYLKRRFTSFKHSSECIKSAFCPVMSFMVGACVGKFL